MTDTPRCPSGAKGDDKAVPYVLVPDCELRWEVLGYQAMSKTEHSIHSRRVMNLLMELEERRAKDKEKAE